MSAEAVAWVYRYSPYSGVKFSIHQAIADTVNDTNGNEFWMRPAKLARKARTTRQTASTYLTEMVQEGFLEQLGDRSSGGDAPEGRFRFLTPEVPMQYDPLAPGGTVSSADGGGHRQESRRCTVSSADSTVSSADGKEPNRTQEETQVASSSSPSASTTISEGSDGGGVDGSSVVGRGPLLVDGSEDSQVETDPAVRLINEAIEREYGTAKAKACVFSQDGKPAPWLRHNRQYLTPEQALEVVRLAVAFSDACEQAGNRRPNPFTHKALTPIKLLLHLDAKPPEHIQALITWAFTNDFWATNIRSTAKLRYQWDTLRGQRNRDLAKRKAQAHEPAPAGEDWMARRAY